jgi:hypothetical protein
VNGEAKLWISSERAKLLIGDPFGFKARLAQQQGRVPKGTPAEEFLDLHFLWFQAFYEEGETWI